jgi:hypothetical protein
MAGTFRTLLRDNDEFDPKHDLFDFLLFQTLTEAFQKDFNGPFRSTYIDAENKVIKEASIVVVGEHVKETGMKWNHSTDAFQFPLKCKLIDAKGRACTRSMTKELMLKFLESSPRDQNGLVDLTFDL